MSRQAIELSGVVTCLVSQVDGLGAVAFVSRPIGEGSQLGPIGLLLLKRGN